MDGKIPKGNRSGIILVTALLLSACGEDMSADKQKTQLPPIPTTESVLIQCDGDCVGAINNVKQAGGTVTHAYKNIAAIAATVPADFGQNAQNHKTIKAIAKDSIVAKPIPRHNLNLKHSVGPNIITNVNLNQSNIANYLPFLPKGYNFNNRLMGATDLHAEGITGEGVIVAVIDSGTANNANIVPALSDSVIGGENFVELPDEPSATSTLNDAHGTWVGSMIAAHIGIVVPNDVPLAQSLQTHAPESIFPFTDTESLIPMIGSAPDAKLYAMKVFAADGAGTPASIVIAAMDRALTLKRNFDDGLPSTPVAGDGTEDNPYIYDSLNIQVVNMSLGGPTLFPGWALEDLLALQMLKQGITVVAASGNEGFAAITGGSPGTSVGSLTVGAANTPQHERILRDLQLGLGQGIAFRPSNNIQIAPFSSRGPTADGRIGLHVVTNGLASFVQDISGDITLISGTSFSSPTTAGAAALLWQAKPDSKAAEIRSALIASANSTVFDDFSIHAIDQGNGYLDLPAALALLINGEVKAKIPRLPKLDDEPMEIADNISDLKLNVIELEDDESYTKMLRLKPGEVSHLFIETELEIDQITINLTEYQPSLPDDQQNVIFGDAFLMTLVDAPTSINDILLDERIQEDTQFTIDKPQSGLLRLAFMGDWTNAGNVAARLELSATERDLTRKFAKGTLADDESDLFEVDVNANVTELNFELSWKADWGHYPPHDIDLILIDPLQQFNFDGATLDIPERVTITDPTPGTWNVMITGFMLHGFEDKYELRITDQNNRPLR